VIRDFLGTLETRVLLAHVTGRDRAWLLSHAEERLTPEQEKALETGLNRLQDGVPLPYIIGHWEFFGLDFTVTPDVLIPRPETELLVEFALDWAKKGDTQGRPYRFIDVGTGSGIIPVTLATRLPTATFLATDISPAALAVARANAERHHAAERIRFVECDLLPGTGQWTVDSGQWSIVNRQSSIVTANLPYIPTETMKGLPIYGKEPTLALDGGADGLELIRRLLARLTADKLEVGLILLEIETRQGDAVSALARENVPQAEIHVKKDLAGHDRLVVIEIGV
jgi:release factor glutamine methyltransferase